MTSSATVPPGPSPRPWGPRLPLHLRPVPVRSIPTPVGTTSPRSAASPTRPVHPHARGDHTPMPAARCISPGPSPRPWGPRPLALLLGAEHGPSPRPWGPHQQHIPAPLPGRSIPTPVGTTAQRACSPRAGAVHPHARGDHALATLLAPCQTRSIPTPVGTTISSRTSAARTSVHPHARGDHIPLQDQINLTTGPSPCPWGPRAVVEAPVGAVRSISTPVGTTRELVCWRQYPTVHPHARGDHSKQNAWILKTIGPSPRPWGPRRRIHREAEPIRSIPTPVGTTTPAAASPTT